MISPRDLDSFELRALKNLVNGEGAYLTEPMVRRLMLLSLASRSGDGKIRASELGKEVVLQSRMALVSLVEGRDTGQTSPHPAAVEWGKMRAPHGRIINGAGDYLSRVRLWIAERVTALKARHVARRGDPLGRQHGGRDTFRRDRSSSLAVPFLVQ